MHIIPQLAPIWQIVIYSHRGVIRIWGDVHINSQMGVFYLGGLLWYKGMHMLAIGGRIINTMGNAYLRWYQHKTIFHSKNIYGIMLCTVG